MTGSVSVGGHSVWLDAKFPPKIVGASLPVGFSILQSLGQYLYKRNSRQLRALDKIFVEVDEFYPSANQLAKSQVIFVLEFGSRLDQSLA